MPFENEIPKNGRKSAETQEERSTARHKYFPSCVLSINMIVYIFVHTRDTPGVKYLIDHSIYLGRAARVFRVH